MMDKEVLREVWHGQLPLCFSLHQDDVIGMHRPEPYYMMVSRITYFPMVLDRVVKYFNRFIDQSKQVMTNDMWLDYNGQPVKWHHPIGLSWDLIGSNYDLPWKLILHFSEFPASELLRCNTKSTIEANFMSSLKEADALKHKGAIMMSMQKKEQTQLWTGLLNNNFDQFWLVNRRLMERTDNKLFRFIPFRLYFPDYRYLQKAIRPCTTERLIFSNSFTRVSEKSSASTNIGNVSPSSIPNLWNDYDTDIVMNKLPKCSHSSDDQSKVDKAGLEEEKHRCSTMLDLIQISFKDRLDDLLITRAKSLRENQQLDDDGAISSRDADRDDDSNSNNQRSESHQMSDSESPPPLSSSNEKNKPSVISGKDVSPSELIDVRLFKYCFLLHGIEVPFDTPLQWLSEHLSYPDNFLHICAVMKDNMDYR